MAISVYDVNTHLKNDTTMVSIAGKVMNFFPVVAPGQESPPYVVYFYNPMVSSPDTHWERADYIKYSIFDTDVDRLFQLSERFIDLLSKADQIGRDNGILSNTIRYLYGKQTGSSLSAPLEINGFYRMNLDFKICAVAL